MKLPSGSTHWTGTCSTSANKAFRSATSVAGGSAASVHRCVVGFARDQPGQFRNHRGAHRPGRNVRQGGGQLPNLVGARLTRVHGGDGESVDIVRAQRRHSAFGQAALHPVQVDAQSEQLHESSAAADDLVQAFGRASCDVAGAQFLDRGAEGQIRRPRRISQHHIGPTVDQLTGAAGPAVSGADGQAPAGNRTSDRFGVCQSQFRWQLSHPGGRLGRPVHR